MWLRAPLLREQMRHESAEKASQPAQVGRVREETSSLSLLQQGVRFRHARRSPRQVRSFPSRLSTSLRNRGVTERRFGGALERPLHHASSVLHLQRRRLPFQGTLRNCLNSKSSIFLVRGSGLTYCSGFLQGNRFSLDKHLEESAKMHLSLMCSVVTKQQHQITSLKSAISKLSLNYTGTLIWKITDYSAKMSEAKAKEGMELVSPPFYTSQYGYKLQVRVRVFK